MTKLLKICVLGFMALGFVACDEVSNAVESATKEGKKLAQALSIEQPLLGVFSGEALGDYVTFLYIQSQDNNTIYRGYYHQSWELCDRQICNR